MRWECGRFLRRAAPKSGWKYDEALVERIGRFCEMLPFPEGEWESPAVLLGDWQKFLIAGVYGWRSRADPRYRAVRECMLAVPRKAGKSAFAAMLAIVDLALMDRNNPRIVCAGPTERQARFPYEKALAITRRDPLLCERFSIRASGAQIRRTDAQGGTIVTTSGSAGTQDGENPSMVIYEETHAERNPAMLGVHRNSFGARRNPLLFLPTTAGDTPASVGQEEREVYLRMAGTQDGSDELFGLLYEADKTDDPSDPATWHKAQPSLGLTVDLPYYRHLHDTSLGDNDKWGKFLTRQLNIWQGGDAQALVDIDGFRALPRIGEDWREFPRLQRAWIGIDLSEVSDLASITLLGELPGGGLGAWWEVWVPGKAADLAEERKLTKGVGGQSRYAEWIREGYLRRTEGAVIRHEPLAQTIREMCARHNVLIICSDVFAGIAELFSLLPERLAARLERMRKIAYQYTPPTNTLLGLIAEGGLHIRYSPVVDWCFASCVAERRVDGSILPKKISDGSPDKIDCVDSLIVSLAARASSLAPRRDADRGPLGIEESRLLKQKPIFI